METRSVLVTGATGLLGGYLTRSPALASAGSIVGCGGPARAGQPVRRESHGTSSAERVDLGDRDEVARLFDRLVASNRRPGLVLHAAALAAVGDCARDPSLARRVNVEGTAHLAAAARDVGARLLVVSTDMLFDGEHAPYAEDSPTCPASVYGRSKREAELAALDGTTDVVVVRVSLLFGPTLTSRRGFFDTQLAALRSATALTLFDDEWRTPLSLLAAAEGLAAVARSELRGLVHLGGPERMSRWDMGLRLARVTGAPTSSLIASSRLSVGGEPRPADLSLDSSAFRRRFPGMATASFEEECARMLELRTRSHD